MWIQRVCKNGSFRMLDRDMMTAVQQRLNIYLPGPYFEKSSSILYLITIKIKARLC